MYFKRIIPLFACFVLVQNVSAQKKYTLLSPDKSISVAISAGDSITYSVTMDGKEIVGQSFIAFKTDADKPGARKISKALTSSNNEWIKPVVFQKTNAVQDVYNQLHIDFSSGVSLEWRAYNNGIAWHWITSHKTAYKVLDEQSVFGLDKKTWSWYPLEESFFSHNERIYKHWPMDSITDSKLASLPALFDVNGTKLLLTESSLFNYAGMWLRGSTNGQLKAVFPNYPKEKRIRGDRTEQIVSREDFIAKGEGPQSYPWRIVMIAREDTGILTNQLPYLLGRPSTGDYSWVRPGKVQWDWWHANNIWGVDFRAGINNDTYKYYIDFAAKYGLEYVLLDEGWCDTRDLMKQAPGINVEELAAYAKAKKVDLILWTSWLVLDRQLDTALDVFAKWGIKGIKVDFMQRDDQDMVNYYERVTKATAARKMMVSFHGAYKPTGWLRSYPNIVSSEGVYGNENNKWANNVDPEHTTTIPFIRMAAGPMDFTPGSMLNTQKNAFAIVYTEPMTLGTRANQLAMYVVFESLWQMLCDMPTHYYREPETMEFLKTVPVEWVNTVPLQAKVGDYIAVARQAKNGDWFIGAMTDWTARQLSLNLSFLGDGKYKMQVWKDGINADRNAKDCKMETIEVDKNSVINVKMATGGGYVARLVKQ